MIHDLFAFVLLINFAVHLWFVVERTFIKPDAKIMNSLEKSFHDYRDMLARNSGLKPWLIEEVMFGLSAFLVVVYAGK